VHGLFNGASFGNGSLADSAVVGAKAGGFFPEALNWFGVEAELFNTTPHIEQQGAAAARDDIRHQCDRPSAVCLRKEASRNRTGHGTVRLPLRQGILSAAAVRRRRLGYLLGGYLNSAFSAHANFVPGFNALAGVRYYFTDRIALFTEYKYNRATFNFAGVQGLAGFEGVYSVNHIVGGVSYHY